MATQITTLTAGYITIQAGHGVPSHVASKGSQYTDVDTATIYYNKDGLSNWQLDGGNAFTGGTVVGFTTFLNGLSATTISATTFYGDGSHLTGISTQDTFVTGGTYSSGTATFTNNTGGTFNVSGFLTGMTDTYTTGFTYNNNTLTLKRNANQPDLNVLINTMTGLTVSGDLTVTGGTQSWFSGNSSSDLVRITQTGSGNALVVEDSDNPDISQFVVDNAGNVGIGINTPISKLQISNTATTVSSALYTSDFVTLTAQDTAPGFNIVSAGDQTGYRGVFKSTRSRGTLSNPIVPQSGDATFSLLGAVYDGITNISTAGVTFEVDGTVTASTAPQRIIFATGVASRIERMRITSDGKVGIGVTSPTTPLHVRTSGVTSTNEPIARFDLLDASGAYFAINNGSTLDGVFVPEIFGRQASTSGQLAAFFGGYIDPLQDTGTTVPVTVFRSAVAGGTTISTRPLFDFRNWTTSVMLLSSSGNVGIGTSLPTDRLTVSGNTNIYGGLTANTISATTYYNLPIDIYTTGGTYSSGTTTFTNNTGGTFNISGYYTGTTNLGNILFVSSYGNDSTGVKGYIDRPFLTLKGARDAAISGDTIHVFPRTFIFDNRATNSLFWNGKQADINLWKNGVTYFFEPNCKIKFYNQTITGQDLYLISPTITTGETCTVLGYLEYEQYGVGADTFNGSCAFYSVGAAYSGSPVNANAHTFYAEVKSLYSESCEYINIVRSVVGTAESKITIIANNETKKYISGQSGFGSAVYVSGIMNGATDDPYLTLTLTSKYRDIYAWFPFYIRGNLNGSKLNIFGDVCIYRTNGNLLRDGKSTVNYTVGKTYYTTHTTGNNWYGSFVSTSSFSNGTFNIKGDLIDYVDNTYTTGVLHIGNTSHNNTFNFDGNITTKTNSGIGRFIALTDGVVSGNTINIKGDINYIGTGTTSQYIFRSNGGSGNTINYTGKITGNFAAPITNCYKGTININNSNIKSTIDGTSSSIGLNGSTSLGTIRINNSYIELKNSTNFISNGSYVNNYINNSTIVNSVGSGLSNTTAFGLLQILNSTIITSGISINYTSTSSVISSNSTTNNTYDINTLYGDISSTTEITF